MTYGVCDPEASSSTNLADWVYGHRFGADQTWLEYTLEFLNVVIGYQYQLGRGVDKGDYYVRFKRLGLRRFVFYHDERKSRHPKDDQALRLLYERLAEKVTTEPSDEDGLECIRSLLRSFSAVERSRSWYAKFLFPAHEAMLFWEALRRGSRRGKTSATMEDTCGLAPGSLDAGITFADRNFFSRGGELIYLMLSAGTEGNPSRRNLIERRLRDLLTRNVGLGAVAKLVDDTWQSIGGSGDGNEDPGARGLPGWLPDRDFPTYTLLAEDMESLLGLQLDQVEMFSLMAYLVAFHVVVYLYARAMPRGECAPLLVDCMEAGDDHTIREVSAVLYRVNQESLVAAVRRYIEHQAFLWASKQWPWGTMEDHFGLQGRGRETSNWEDKVREVAAIGTVNDIKAALVEAMEGLFMPNYHTKFIPVHRRLAQQIGLVAPRTGTSQRYTLGSSLLKALVLANVGGGQQLEYLEFLHRLYARYGLVIGPAEAEKTPILGDYDINRVYYQSNRRAFRIKLGNAGLLVEYSDATAMVHNPSHPARGGANDR